MGNSKARAVYEANLPDGFKRPTTDPQLETFIRSKYEQKKYLAKEWVQPQPPPPAVSIQINFISIYRPYLLFVYLFFYQP